MSLYTTSDKNEVLPRCKGNRLGLGALAHIQSTKDRASNSMVSAGHKKRVSFDIGVLEGEADEERGRKNEEEVHNPLEERAEWEWEGVGEGNGQVT